MSEHWPSSAAAAPRSPAAPCKKKVKAAFKQTPMPIASLRPTPLRLSPCDALETAPLAPLPPRSTARRGLAGGRGGDSDGGKTEQGLSPPLLQRTRIALCCFLLEEMGVVEKGR